MAVGKRQVERERVRETRWRRRRAAKQLSTPEGRRLAQATFLLEDVRRMLHKQGMRLRVVGDGAETVWYVSGTERILAYHPASAEVVYDRGNGERIAVSNPEQVVALARLRLGLPTR